MEYGVLVKGEFQERELISIHAKGFENPITGRHGTYDHYVMKEINRSYGKLKVEDQIVLDVGANIGAFSCWASQKKAKHVISIEPEANNFAMLELNMRDHYGVESTLYNAGLHSSLDEPSVLYLATSGKNPGNSSTTPRRGRSESSINLMSVKSLKEKHPFIDVAKIDCEGAEYDFMELLIESYPKMKQVSLEIHLSGFSIDKAVKLHHMMIENGYRTTVPPRLDNDRLWQTLATYNKDVI